jgi:hypothetical protein
MKRNGGPPRFGSPYYAPLSFVALTVLGIAMLPKLSKANSKAF